jgi:hypothetical protein
MMRFMTLWRPGKNSNANSEKMFVEMGQLIEEMTKAGVLVTTGGWDPNGPSTFLKANAEGKVTVTDGPFAEAKEVIAGFAIIETKSKEEAVQWGVRFLKIAGEGTSELRALGEPPPR